MSDIVLWGGPFPESDTMIFLQGWNFDTMPYTILETITQPVQFIETSHVYETNIDLVRLHVFGDGGDLTVRRDGRDFYWRYVGYVQPTQPVNCEVFQRSLSLGSTITTMLWGRWNQEKQIWQENRVGKALLEYPHIADAERVQLTSVEVYAGKELVAIWTTGLQEAR